MRVSIIADDNTVYVDGKWATVDTSALAADGISAVQWYDTWGEEEYRTVIEDGALTRAPNILIADFAPYQTYVDQWRAEFEKRMAEEAEKLRDIAEQKQRAKEVERLLNEPATKPAPAD